MGKRIVILGAGFGGLACTNALQKSLARDHRVIVIDKKKSFVMGLVNLWMLAGSRRLDESQTPLACLNARGIEYLNDDAITIDISANRVQARDHGWIDYDYLVVALGSELAPEKVDGFVGRGYNLYDPEQVQPLRKELLSLKEGRVVVSVMGVPYKCPPAPYEAAMIINDVLKKNGTREKVQVDMYVPTPIALPVVGTQISKQIVDTIARYNIGFHANCKPTVVKDDEIEFESGEKAAYDVLVGIPPHRSPEVVKSAGLTKTTTSAGTTTATTPTNTNTPSATATTTTAAAAGEWIPVDSLTLRTVHPRVFAIGDVAEVRSGAVTVPKAGIFAEGQAKVVAQEILDEINKAQIQPASPPLVSSSSVVYDGKGFCFMEVGNNMAGLIEADFYHEGGPVVKLESPSTEGYEKKHDFERSRTKEWLL